MADVNAETDIDIKKVLEEISPNLSAIAIDCADALFGWSLKVPIPWSVTNSLEGVFDYIFMMPSKNDKYSAFMVIGIGCESLRRLWGSEITLDDAKDAFGEYANTYCGMVQDVEAHNRNFGYLLNGFVEDAIVQTFFPLQWAVHGRGFVGQEPIYFGYSIKKETFDFHSIADSL